MMVESFATTSPTKQDQTAINRIVTLSVRGLVPMFDQQRQLFCYSLNKADRGMVQEGISHRYTMMTLMGLHRFEQAGGESPVPIDLVLDGMLRNLDWVTDIGDLGLLIWTCAQIAPEWLASVGERIDLAGSLTRYRNAKRGVTMELAWFLTGLSNWALAVPEKASSLHDLAVKTFELLKKNRGEQGFFGHLTRSASLAGMTRGRIGSFADQVYPVYGMSRFSQAFGDESALKMALQLGRGLCEAQGSLGQWWWHYDSVTGRVLEGYPVFSVHQHAMGPMTMFALGEAAQQDFSPWIYRGLKWINFENELGVNMEDDVANVIWRCQYRPISQVRTYLKAALSIGGSNRGYEAKKDLRVLYTCRPYELGWLLYAFARRTESPATLSARIAIPQTTISEKR